MPTDSRVLVLFMVAWLHVIVSRNEVAEMSYFIFFSQCCNKVVVATAMIYSFYICKSVYCWKIHNNNS